jgi:hypothetical protein
MAMMVAPPSRVAQERRMVSEKSTVACPECRRPWETFGLDSACPVCGTGAATTFVTEVIDSATGQIDADVACTACAYNLRMQPAQGRCPECGTAIAASLVRGRLIFMPIDWLRRVSVGVRETFLALAIAAVGLLVIVAMTPGVMLPGGFGMPMLVSIGLGVAYFVVTPVVWMFGVWQATRPNPADAPEWRHLQWRAVWARWLMAAGIFFFIVLYILLSIAARTGPFGDRFFYLSACLGFMMPLSFLLSALLYATILRTYMMQQNRVWLPRMLRAWAWLIGAGAVSFAAMVLLVWMEMSMGSRMYDVWSYRYDEFRDFVTTLTPVLLLASLSVGLYATFGAWRQFRAIIRWRESAAIIVSGKPMAS